MTGYGRGTHSGQTYLVEVELKSVNHRFRDIVVRARPEVAWVTERIRDVLARHIDRGRVDVLLSLTPLPGRRTVQIDMELAVSYNRALEELRRRLGMSEGEQPPALELIARFPGVLSTAEAVIDPEQCWQDVEPALTEAVAGLQQMRATEGASLAAALNDSLDRLNALLTTIAERAPAVPVEYRQRLSDRLAWLTADTATVSAEALAAEVVLFAVRSDITEELVRLRSHSYQFAEAMQVAEPVGRKLDFILQEMAREINTIAAKAHDHQIAAAVVDVKSEIERMREQVQNIQ